MNKLQKPTKTTMTNAAAKLTTVMFIYIRNQMEIQQLNSYIHRVLVLS